MTYKGTVILIILVLLVITLTGCTNLFCDKVTYFNVTKNISYRYSECNIGNTINCHDGVVNNQYTETYNTTERVLCSMEYPK
jgi:hypothetical protein